MSKYKLKFIRQLPGNICTGYQPQPAVLQSISKQLFFKMPSVFLIFTVFSSVQSFECLFSVPLSSADISLCWFLFYICCAQCFSCFVSHLLYISPPIESLTVPLAFSFFHLSCMINAAIRFPMGSIRNTKGESIERVCVCEHCV